MESKKHNKVVNKAKRSRLTDIENTLVVTSGEKEEGWGKTEAGGKKVIIGIYGIMCMKLESCKTLYNLKHLSSNKKE